eukprot:scaffold312487_cov15-Prasinocladus_malaysianus.AAC.1
MWYTHPARYPRVDSISQSTDLLHEQQPSGNDKSFDRPLSHCEEYHKKVRVDRTHSLAAILAAGWGERAGAPKARAVVVTAGWEGWEAKEEAAKEKSCTSGQAVC